MKPVMLAVVASALLTACSQGSPRPDDPTKKTDSREAKLESRIKELEAQVQREQRSAEAKQKNNQEASARRERMAWLAGEWTSSADMSGCGLGVVYGADGTWTLPRTHSGTYEITARKIVHTPTSVERQPWIDEQLREGLKRPHTLYFERIDEETMRARLEGKEWHTSYKCS